MISDSRNYGLDMTHANLAFLIGWLINGKVYLTRLFLQIPLTHLKLDWINFGTIKNQDVVYDLRTQLQGTGSRIEVLCEKFQ